jgi:alanyl-tRNA synthetase
MKSSAEIRQSFIDFFAQKDHQIVASSSLIPGNDPTLLFTNAGMVQFKETFLGQEERPYNKAVSVQRCVRAGGKHNDLENVGYTARHHTFFEMLGNFSFGDYFKHDAIRYGWEYLTKVCNLPAEKLWITVYENDDEAAYIWLKEVGVDPERFTRIGDKPGGKKHESDNFWSMGDTGPCGPCTEIFYDHGAEIAGGPPGSPEEDGDRYIEIWNLVFMQYNRDANGKMTPLPKPSVDTGMGLERLAAILQNGHSNYDIDLFQNLIKAVAKIADIGDFENASLKVIADHIRSCAFLIVDGVVPSNEGRGYVLRRIVRRAIRHGHKLGIREPFFHKLVAALDKEMGDAYPELSKLVPHVEKVLLQEENRFAETLDQGMTLLESALADIKGDTIAGDVVFKLYDTYGFPVDLTADIARERGLKIDMAGFEADMGAQRERARAASHFVMDGSDELDIDIATQFSGYDSLSGENSIATIIQNGAVVAALNSGEKGMLVLAETPFYAESGGQMGDHGEITLGDARFKVTDTRKQKGAFIHIGKLISGSLKVGDKVTATVYADCRQQTAIHHSVTHLLHAVLRQILGDHVQQKGSMVTDDKLRFDFSHFEAIKAEELAEIEQLVNSKIRENLLVDTKIMNIDEAKSSGAMALFGEKYGSDVRVLSMGDFSIELCGGTHVSRTGDIGLFKITSEQGVAAGVRRIEAVAGIHALNWVARNDQMLVDTADLVKGSRDNLVTKVEQVVEKNRLLEKELQQLKSKLASSQGSDLAGQAIEIDGIKVLAAKLDGVETKALRDTLDQLKNKLHKAAIILAVVNGDKITLVAGVTKDESSKIKAGELLQMVAEQVGGKGGGRPDMAQGGGSEPEKLDAALASVDGWIRGQLAR